MFELTLCKWSLFHGRCIRISDACCLYTELQLLDGLHPRGPGRWGLLRLGELDTMRTEDGEHHVEHFRTILLLYPQKIYSELWAFSFIYKYTHL